MARKGKVKFLLVVFLLIILIGGGLTYTFMSKPQPNVLVLMLDTLRADHLSMNGYERDTTPVIDQFCQDNLNFSAAIPAAPWTPPSVASVLTGLYATAHGMMPPNSRNEARKTSTSLSNNLKTMAEVFKENGYQTGAVTPNPWMKTEFNFQQGFDFYEYHHRVRAEKINSEGIKILEKFSAEDKPFFLYLHYLDPHNPYNPPGKFHDMYTGPLKSREYEEKMVRYIGLYDGEIRYMDTELGKLFGHLKEKGLYEDLIIVLLADHGEQFKEHGHHGHGFQLYNEEIHVPLAIKANDLKGDVSSAVSTVDIFPTIAELAGIKLNHPIQGLSLLDSGALATRAGVFSEIKRRHDLKAFVDSFGHKLIINGSNQTTELYDSRKDYAEKNPLPSSDLEKGIRENFKRVLKESLELRKNIDVNQVEIQNDTIEELKTLGYL